MKYNSNTILSLTKFFILNSTFLIISCSASAQISQSAQKILINDSVISTGHIGISIYDPAANTYLYTYNDTRYFMPASNTKLFTLYAGMKYLGDSLVGLKGSILGGDTTLISTGDPTFLHKDFPSQPVFDFLRKGKNLTYPWRFFESFSYGKGWAWDDYTEDFMPYPSRFPIYGNVFSIDVNNKGSLDVIPTSLKPLPYSPHLDFKKGISAKRDWNNNTVIINEGKDLSVEIPFIPIDTAEIKMLSDTLGKKISAITGFRCVLYNDSVYKTFHLMKPIYSRPVDSLFKPMIHNSDNFFAEQTLLMASDARLNKMNTELIIDTLLNTDLIDVPQKPKWVDGSGLSRYNLFTPNDFVYILNKMKNEFGLKRMEVILPTGGGGSLKNYYLQDSGFIYAKTGTLSNNTSLSGYIITKRNKLLVFSILVNNYIGSGTPVKKAIEKFLEEIREKY
jgi:D-alanyl-D-alanine carboxypeptidase/D-alanyl-D-alanine-endopeptidase (penicillin-binding protein 4)